MEDPYENEFSSKQNVLAMQLQHRRSREVLAEQGIIPSMNNLGSHYAQAQRLERAWKEDYLKHAIQGRPERNALVQKNILEDTNATGCIVSNQKDLKKAKLVDDLNDKLASRPGVIELVERNIIPADEDVQEAIKGGHFHFKNIVDYNDEDDALSPEQMSSLRLSSPVFPISSTVPLSIAQSTIAFTSKEDNSAITRTTSTQSLFTQSSSHPYLSRQLSKGNKMGQGGLMPRMVANARKKKDKPKFKKFKYHQYVPPDQQGKSEDRRTAGHDDDTPYSRLLQQQQMYLQLQIMNKQFNNYRNGDTHHNSYNHHNMVSPSDDLPLTQTMKMEKSRNPNAPLIASKLDEMKVTELKEELKQRGQKVTGTKEVLVERLRPFCVSSENAFLSNLSRTENGTMNYSLSSPSVMNENMSDGQMTGHSVTKNNAPQTAFAIDPNIVHKHKIARMPVPEQHKVVLKQEKLTMPTWHHAGGDTRLQQTMSPPGQGASSGYMPEQLTRDKILEEQQMEINNLKRMLQMQQQQLHVRNHQVKKEQIQVMTKPLHTALLSKTVFQFPTASHTDHVHNRPSSSNHHPSQSPHSSHKEADPPNYEQAFEMMNENKGSVKQSDYMEMYQRNAPHMHEHRTPPVARVLLNDHNSYYGLNGQSANMGQSTPYPQRSDYVAQEQAQLQHEARQNHINKMKHQQGYGNIDYSNKGGRLPDLTKMLVESAGDALMDTSNFPPTINRCSNNLDPYALEHHHHRHQQQQQHQQTQASARNSVDSGIMYSTPFSPMDTNNADLGSRELLSDLRCSTSSLDSCEPTLNAVSASPATPPRARPQNNAAYPANHFSSPKLINRNLVKSSSQELLSSDSLSSNNDLGWLDLTLGSAITVPPSPGGPFETMNVVGDQALTHPNYPSYHGSQDADLNLCADGSSNNLDYPPNSSALVPQWDNWEGLLGTDFNS